MIRDAKESLMLPSCRPYEAHRGPTMLTSCKHQEDLVSYRSKIRFVVMIDMGTPHMDYLMLPTTAGTG